MVVGGEYLAVTGNNPVWTNIGFMYDPVANTWSNQLTVPFGGGCVGDASSIVLENGTMILADGTDCTTNGNLASFNPATLTFTALNPTGKADRNNEENWAILPDGRGSHDRCQSRGSVRDLRPGDEYVGEPGEHRGEHGRFRRRSSAILLRLVPAVLRPDGTAIYFSGNSLGQNAVYNIATEYLVEYRRDEFRRFGPGGRRH